MKCSSGSGAGSCVGLVVMAAVSTGIILISYHLHRRLEADMKVKIGEGAANLQDRRRRRPRAGATKRVKKVRFADDVVEPSSNNEEYRRRVWSSSPSPPTIISSSAAAEGAVDAETLSLSLGRHRGRATPSSRCRLRPTRCGGAPAGRRSPTTHAGSARDERSRSPGG